MMHKLELMLNKVSTDAGIERSKFAYSADLRQTRVIGIT